MAFKASTIISNLIRFDLGFWQTSKPFYRKLKSTENVSEEFQRLLPFPRKMVFYSSINFHILKPWAIISNVIKFDLGFWQDSKQIYRRHKHSEKLFEDFQRLPRFPREMGLYSSTKFGISKLLTIISNHLISNHGISNHVFRSA